MNAILHFRRKDFPLNEACFLELLQMLGYGRFRNGQHLMDITEETLVPLGQKTQDGDPGRMPHRFGKTCQLLLCTGIALFFHYKTAHIVRKYTNNIEITNPSLPEKHIRFIYPANKKKTEIRSAFHTPQAKSIPPANKKRQKPDLRFIPRKQSQFPRQTKKDRNPIPSDSCPCRTFCRALWSGKRDSDPRPPPWQGGALPLSYFRNACQKNFVERKTGFGPATPTLARWCSTTELFPQCVSKNFVERKTGLEPATPTLGRSCSTN